MSPVTVECSVCFHYIPIDDALTDLKNVFQYICMKCWRSSVTQEIEILKSKIEKLEMSLR